MERSDCYVYLISRPDGTPCYVGMGHGKRWKAHATRTHNPRLAALYSRNGGMLPVVKIKEGLTREEACSAEVALIAAIGRADKNAGPLFNFTDGGEGRAGDTRPKSPEHAAKLRDVCLRMRDLRKPRPKGLPRTAAEIASKPIMQRGVPKSEAQKAKMAAARVGRTLSAAHRAAIGASHRGKKRANTEKMSAAQRSRAEELRAEAIARPRSQGGRFVPVGVYANGG